MSDASDVADFAAMELRKDFLVVGLGGSAGAIPAFREFFRNVTPDSGMAYVVILHLSPEHDSRLAEVLQGSSAIPVTQVREQVKVEPNHVYVIPPNQSLAMNDGSLVLSPITGFEERRAPVDIFFRTLGEAHESRAVCVILSGSGSDGSMGLRRVKEHNGLVLVQEPAEAQFDEMPRHSIATGLVDVVLPVADMPARIAAYRDQIRETPLRFDSDESDEQALIDIFTSLRTRTGHDFSNYKRATVLRRIERRMALHALTRLPQYAQFLRERSEEADLLLRELLISVTNFFRDAKVWETVEQRVITKLLEGKRAEDHVRVWVAGCATGEEAYSVAMLLVEAASAMAVPPDIQIFATDLDEDAIAKARNGCYSDADVADVSPERLRRHFVREQENYRVRRELRELILFAHHNLIKDPPFSHIDFISCRNLLIYLNRTAQERTMEVLHFALEPGGWLLLGTAESSDGASQLFSAFDKEAHLYQSREVPRVVSMPTPPRHLTIASDLRAPQQPPDQREQRGARFTALELHHRLIEDYAPPSLIIDEQHNIVHLSERAGRYLQFAAGEASLNVLQVVRPELRIALRSALLQSAQTRGTVLLRGIDVHTGERSEVVNLIVRPILHEGDVTIDHFLVLFEESREPASIESAPSLRDPAAGQLEQELMRIKGQMRTTVEQYEIQAEEAKAANEELQAINEELRSTAEELETSQEELQSLNEELQTVNQELKVKIEEVGHTNDDLRNLMSSTDIGTIFVDRTLRVKLFTPRARDLFNLIPADVGRPLLDINSKLTSDTLAADLDAVLDRLQTIEREVESRDGRWYLMRLLPYRTAQDRIDGVVLTFLEVTEQHRAQEVLREAQQRQSYLLKLSDALRELSDPAEIQATASRVLGEHLGTGRAYYVEIDEPAGEYVVARDWHRPGETSHARRYPLASWPMPGLSDGRTWSFTDINTDSALPDDQRDAYREIAIGAAVIVPLIKGGKLVATFVTNQRRPRVWTTYEIGLVEETAGRTWAAVERARTEVALRASEERFRSVAESGLLSVAFFDGAGGIADANDAFLKLVGYTREELRAGDVRWDRLTPPDWLSRTEEAVEEYGRTGRIEPYEKEYFRKDGERFWGLFAGQRIETTGEGVALVVDITERKRREANLAFVAEVEGTFAGAYDVSEIMQIAGEKLSRLLDVQRCHFMLIDEPRQEVRFLDEWNAPGQSPLPPAMPLSSVAREAVLEPLRRQETVTSNELADARAGENAKNELLSFITVPFQQRGEHRFVFSVFSSKPRVWRDDEIELVRAVAHRLFPRLDRARAEEALRASEQRLAAVFEALPVGVGFIDTEGKLVVANREMQHWISSGVIPARGSGAASLRWRAWQSDGQPVDPRDYPGARAFRGEKVIPGMEMLFSEDAGDPVWAQVAAVPMENAQGRVTGQVVVITNIDAIKRTEAALRTTEERYRTLFESIDEGFCIVDVLFDDHGKPVDYRFIEVNPAFEKQTGLRDVVGRTMRELVPEHEEHWFQIYGEIARTGMPARFENVARALGRFYEVYGFPFGDSEHRIAILFNDITSRKQADAALRESQQRLQTVTNLVPDLLWSSDAGGLTDWCNERWLEYTGQTFEDACGYGWLDPIHPEELEASRAQFEAAIRAGEPLRLEHRMRSAGGGYRWFLVKAEPLRDTKGQIVRWFGAATDIHEERIAREELEQRVQERTRELAKLSQQRQQLLERLVVATEEERRRIARELHDEMGQHLTALRVLLQTVQPPGDGAGHLKSIVDRLDESVDRLTLELRPPALDHLGLHGAITSLAEEFSAASGVRVDVHLPGVDRERFGDGIETALYRVVQEALTNVWKHSGAKTVSVIIERDGDALRMIVEDDGRGFDGDGALDGEPARGRFGLLGMRERLSLVGGSIHIESQPGSGTTIYGRVSLTDPAAQ